MPPSAQIIHKRGDTFSYGANDVALPVGEAWTATAQVRDPLALDGSAPLTVLNVALTAPVAPSTLWDLSLSAPPTETARWPVSANYTTPKVLVCDIEFTCSSNPGLVVSSSTLQILVYRDVTR